MFRSFEWGTTSVEVVRSYQHVTYADSEQNSVLPEKWFPGTERLYREVRRNQDLLGEGYIFHPGEGLVKGYLRVYFEDSDDCIKTYERYRQQFVNRYNLDEDFHVRNGKTNNLDTNFCSAVLVGEAAQWDSWEDKQGNKIIMFVGGKLSKRRITILVESRKYYRWKDSSPLVDWIRVFWARLLQSAGYS